MSSRDTKKRKGGPPLAWYGWVGLGLILAIAALVMAAPVLSPYPSTRQDLSRILAGPSAAHWFGTDQLGRDVLSRVLHGGLVTLLGSSASVVGAMAVGVPVGLIAGYYGSWIEAIAMGVVEVLQALPNLLLALVLVAVLGFGPVSVAWAIGVTALPVFVRVTQVGARRLRREQFVEAGVALGASDGRLLGRHILPNLGGPIVAVATTQWARAILIGAALSYFGLGVQPPSPEWGLMISEAAIYIRTRPELLIFPGAAISLTVLAIYLLADALYYRVRRT